MFAIHHLKNLFVIKKKVGGIWTKTYLIGNKLLIKSNCGNSTWDQNKDMVIKMLNSELLVLMELNKELII